MPRTKCSDCTRHGQNSCDMRDQNFRCTRCKKTVPWCQGAADKWPNWCDSCTQVPPGVNVRCPKAIPLKALYGIPWGGNPECPLRTGPWCSRYAFSRYCEPDVVCLPAVSEMSALIKSLTAPKK